MTRSSANQLTLSIVAVVFSILMVTAIPAADQYVFENQTVEPGATGVAIPITVETDEPRHALAFSIKVGDKLTLTGFEATGTPLWSGGLIEDATGELVWGMVLGFSEIGEGSFDENAVIPVGTSVVANLIVDVIGADGETTTVEYMDNLPSFDVEGGSKNRMTTAGIAASPALGSGTITIKKEPDMPGDFRRGDVNGDGILDISDAIADLAYQFLGTFVAICLDAHDFNDSGDVDISDSISSLSFQFVGGVSLPPPAPGHINCGPDPTADTVGDLGCEAYPQDKC